MLDTTTSEGTTGTTSSRPLDFVPAAVALTPQAHAAAAGDRFIRALRELSPEDRAATLALFAGDLRDVIVDMVRDVTDDGK